MLVSPFGYSMSDISRLKEQVEADVVARIEKAVAGNEKLQLFHGTCEKDGEPDYELLKRHVEVWAARHPKEMAEFLVERKQTLDNNYKDTGASESNDLRVGVAMPEPLFQLFTILSPNFAGMKEASIESRTKKFRNFMREFPVFRVCKKI